MGCNFGRPRIPRNPISNEPKANARSWKKKGAKIQRIGGGPWPENAVDLKTSCSVPSKPSLTIVRGDEYRGRTLPTQNLSTPQASSRRDRATTRPDKTAIPSQAPDGAGVDFYKQHGRQPGPSSGTLTRVKRPSMLASVLADRHDLLSRIRSIQKPTGFRNEHKFPWHGEAFPPPCAGAKGPQRGRRIRKLAPCFPLSEPDRVMRRRRRVRWIP